MPDRAFIYCPECEKLGAQIDLYRGNPELHLFRCSNQHVFTWEALMARNPTKIPLAFIEKPSPTDVKAEFWLNPEVLSKFRAKYPQQQSSTVNEVLALHLDADLIVISGDQARELKKHGVRTGAEMLATAIENERLAAENADLVSKQNWLAELLKNAGQEMPV